MGHADIEPELLDYLRNLRLALGMRRAAHAATPVDRDTCIRMIRAEETAWARKHKRVLSASEAHRLGRPSNLQKF